MVFVRILRMSVDASISATVGRSMVESISLVIWIHAAFNWINQKRMLVNVVLGRPHLSLSGISLTEVKKANTKMGTLRDMIPSGYKVLDTAGIDEQAHTCLIIINTNCRTCLYFLLVVKSGPGLTCSLGDMGPIEVSLKASQYKGKVALNSSVV
jgi:hypothetical protein